MRRRAGFVRYDGGLPRANFARCARLCRPAGAHVLLHCDPGLPAWANSFRAYGRSRMGVLELRYTKDFASVRPSTSLQVEHLFRALRFCSGQGHPSNLDPRWVYRPEMPEEGLH